MASGIKFKEHMSWVRWVEDDHASMLLCPDGVLLIKEELFAANDPFSGAKDGLHPWLVLLHCIRQ